MEDLLASDSRRLYLVVVAAVALERGIELIISRRHELRLRARGALEAGQHHYPWMVLLHATFLPACAAEVWWLRRPLLPALAAVMGLLLVAALGLRYWVMASLGQRWTTRVLWVPGEPLVRRGPYRYLRHPNYVAVGVEFFALPLLHTAWLTALAGSVLNTLLLRVRIRVEEEALERWAGYGQPYGRPGTAGEPVP